MTEKPTLLVVDDESDNLDALERVFRKKYHFLKANSGKEALTLLAQNPQVAVVITDQRMPQMTGVELLENTLISHPKMVRILLTGFTDIDSIIAAVNKGHIFRYITKPWDTTDLVNCVEQAMEHFSRAEQLQIKNQELENALKELQLLDQAKNRFMILINHELKTPLTVITSFLDLLTETNLNEEQISFIDRIKKSASRLREIIDDTLILTQATANSLKLQKQPTLLSSIFESVITDLQTDAAKKSLRFKFEVSGGEGKSVPVDPSLLKKSLLHLMGNAIRFSQIQSEIKLIIQNSESHVMIAIENEAPPIPNSVIANLQNPFNVQTEIMNHSKGLGLGLSVADAIIKAHGGNISIKNENIQNQTSLVRVTISLPK